MRARNKYVSPSETHTHPRWWVCVCLLSGKVALLYQGIKSLCWTKRIKSFCVFVLCRRPAKSNIFHARVKDLHSFVFILYARKHKRSPTDKQHFYTFCAHLPHLCKCVYYSIRKRIQSCECMCVWARHSSEHSPKDPHSAKLIDSITNCRSVFATEKNETSRRKRKEKSKIYISGRQHSSESNLKNKFMVRQDSFSRFTVLLTALVQL